MEPSTPGQKAGPAESGGAPGIQAGPAAAGSTPNAQVKSATSPTPASVPSRRELWLFVSAALSIAVIAIALLMARGRPAPATAAAAAPVAARPTAAPEASRPASVQRWSSDNQEHWTGNRRHTAAFEVPADETVSIWMGRVRPILVVRCVDKSVQTFVFTGSAIRIEPNTEDHTVRFGFDNEAELRQRWPDSEEHDALFAPDGAAFARRIAGAQMLRFGYTPHNAEPVVAHFHVSGLAERIGPVAADCGWGK